MTPLSPIPARLSSFLAQRIGGSVLPRVAAPSAQPGVFPVDPAQLPSASVEGLFSHPGGVAVISGPDCFGRPTRPNGGCFNRGTLAAGNTDRLPFVSDCLSYATARHCPRAVADTGEIA